MGNNNSTIKQRRQALDRAWILECTEGLFAQRGYSNTTMADIAEKTEMGMATLYKYFKGKKELYEALLKDRFEKVWPELLATTQSSGSARDRFENFIRASVVLPVRFPPLTRVIVRESLPGLMLPKLNPDDPVARLWTPLDTMLTEICEELIEEQGLDIETEDLVTVVSGITAAFKCRYLESEELEKLPEAVDVIVRFIGHGLEALERRQKKGLEKRT